MKRTAEYASHRSAARLILGYLREELLAFHDQLVRVRERFYPLCLGIKPRRFLSILVVPKTDRVFCLCHKFNSPF